MQTLYTHIHVPRPAEIIPGKKERFKHIDADPSEATVWHFRRLRDYLKVAETFNSTELSGQSKIWEENLKRRLLSGKIGL